MGFEWDEDKNIVNIEKHGIDFESAEEIFSSPLLRGVDNRKDYGEIRWIALGILQGICVVIVYTEHLKVRIISIRRANREETKKYKDRFSKA